VGKNGISKLVNEVTDPQKASVITEEMTKELSRRVAVEEQGEGGEKLNFPPRCGFRNRGMATSITDKTDVRDNHS